MATSNSIDSFGDELFDPPEQPIRSGMAFPVDTKVARQNYLEEDIDDIDSP